MCFARTSQQFMESARRSGLNMTSTSTAAKAAFQSRQLYESPLRERQKNDLRDSNSFRSRTNYSLDLKSIQRVNGKNDQSKNFSFECIKEKMENQMDLIKQQQEAQSYYDMTDEEWQTFGDRFPKGYTKIKVLGRGGFAIVWLGECNNTGELYAIKQIQTQNIHQTHVKEIWFCGNFFENGQAKSQFKNNQGINHIANLVFHESNPKDTWLFFELGGESLGSQLYNMKNEGATHNGKRLYKMVYKKMYLAMRSDTKILKTIIIGIAKALQLISERGIVHSDLKTENVLVHSNKKFLPVSVKLIDYGSAFRFGNLKNFSMATPEYMAPEVLNYITWMQRQDYNEQLIEYLKNYEKQYVIDIWSLGCVMLEIINGLPLWMSLNTKIQIQPNQFQKQEGEEEKQQHERDERQFQENYEQSNKMQYPSFVIKKGLFAVNDRVFGQIIKKQLEVANNLEKVVREQNYSGILVDEKMMIALKGMLQINPSLRMQPEEVIKILSS